MKTIYTLLLAGLAVSPVQAYMASLETESAPASLKGKRITFFYEGARRVTTDKDGRQHDSAPEVSLRFVKFNYGDTSNGINGGKMTYSRTINKHEGVTLTDDGYSGSGYRISGNPTGDSGTWTLYFELDNIGSARYDGTENGQHVVYEDVLFKVTPVDQYAVMPKEHAPRSKADIIGTYPIAKSLARHSMEGKMLVVKPKPGQNLAGQPWALSHMVFGRLHNIGGTKVNHMVACKEFGEAEWRGPNWRNALNGETEPVLFPGYYDYVRTSKVSARIQLSGESSANAYYILNFTTPTSGTLIFHHEDVLDGESMEVCSHIEGIPFEIVDAK